MMLEVIFLVVSTRDLAEGQVKYCYTSLKEKVLIFSMNHTPLNYLCFFSELLFAFYYFIYLIVSSSFNSLLFIILICDIHIVALQVFHSELISSFSH